MAWAPLPKILKGRHHLVLGRLGLCVNPTTTTALLAPRRESVSGIVRLEDVACRLWSTLFPIAPIRKMVEVVEEEIHVGLMVLY